MKDYQKTKAQLIDELETLRRRVTELESKTDVSATKAENNSKQWIARSPRVELYVDIEFMGDFDIVQAKGINLSEGGICFEIAEALPFEIQFALEGKIRKHRAHLIWMKRMPEGGYRFGLKFVRPELHLVI